MKTKHLAKLFGAFVVAVVAAAAMAPLASATTPAKGYEQFAGCPSPSENPIITSCQHSSIYGGYVKLGNKEVPITSTITLSGGTNEFLEHFSYNSKGGLSAVKLKVPGGVIGFTGLTWLLEFLGSEALTLYAETQLAGTPTIHNLQEFTVPVKFHMINGVLGNNCFIGSNSGPVVWNLTTGTSGKLKGTPPKVSFQEEPQEILFAKEGKYVDNTFSAPGANGCVLTLFGFIPISINGIVNSSSGLPAASGTNEAVENITTEVAGSEVVYP
ncbi:MAG TPA: hypothetical protein VMT37_04235 [Solirubrobacterales bacterium]|nr:hypothetical protein [Solirubrobacterales bacterium]